MVIKFEFKIFQLNVVKFVKKVKKWKFVISSFGAIAETSAMTQNQIKSLTNRSRIPKGYNNFLGFFNLHIFYIAHCEKDTYPGINWSTLFYVFTAIINLLP